MLPTTTIDEPQDETSPGAPRAIDRQVGGIVLQVATTQVGICLTGIGLVRLIGQRGVISKAADDLLAIDALGFLVTGITAYLAMRAGRREHQRRLERAADVLFLLCLTVMVVVGLLIAYEIL